MVEGARLESVYTGNCIKGSNPLVSAKRTKNPTDKGLKDIKKKKAVIIEAFLK